MEYKIYFLKDPRTNQIRYVGKTTKKLSHRLLNGHLKDKSKTHKTSWINSLKKENLIPIIELVKFCSSEKLCNFSESFFIKLFGRADRNNGILVNATDGGEGVAGRILSQKTKNKIGKANKIKLSGIKFTDERKKNLKISYKNIPEETKKETAKKISIANTGKKHSKKSKIKMSNAQKKRGTPSQNTKNKISNTLLGFKNKNTSSKYIGVSYISTQNLYRATIRFNRKSIIISHFKEEIYAAISYNIKAFELYGEKAKLNDIANWQNTDITKKYSSKFTGVSYKSKSKKWESAIWIDGNNIYLGSYNNEIDAALKYNEYIIKNKIQKQLNTIC